MSRFPLSAALVALSLGVGTPALADDLYPRIVGTGENQDIDYGPGGNRSAPFGGGRFEVIGRNSEGQAELRYLDPHHAQPARIGLVPVSVGSGEGSTTVWVPAGTAATRLALIGADGSLLAEPMGSGVLAGLAGRR